MSPKTPRDISGQQLVKLLLKHGYEVVRQKGSHVRLSHSSSESTHHITIPNHAPIKLGTLSSILQDICTHLEITRDGLLSNIK